VNGGEFVLAFGGGDLAVFEFYVLGIEDAERFVGSDGYVLEEDVGGGGFGEAPD